MPEQEDHRLIKPIEAAHFLALSRNWLAKLRLIGDGPPYMKVGRRSATAEPTSWRGPKRACAAAPVTLMRPVTSAQPRAAARPGSSRMKLRAALVQKASVLPTGLAVHT